MVIESHAWRDDVDDGRPAMGDRGLDERDDLLAVSAEGSGDERAAQRQRDRAGIDGLKRVDRAFLLYRPEVRGGRELASMLRRIMCMN
jgi:hypothetical protein